MRTTDSGTWAGSPEEVEALQAVVDRVSSWQDGAEDAVVEQEFARVAAEVGIEVPDDLARRLCAVIEDGSRRPDLSDFVVAE